MGEPEHDLVTVLAGLVVLLLVLAAARHYSRRSRFPAESWILILGLAYGLMQKRLPALPVLELSPDLVLLLPLLIFASARSLAPKDLRAMALPIGFLATAGVVATLFLIGLPLHWMSVLPLADALLFAAAVAATDPSAVSAIFQRFAIPEPLAALVEGESLFNDGTAIVMFLAMASLAVGMEAFMLAGTLLTLLWTLGVAVALGVVLGWCAAWITLRWSAKNQFSGISTTLALVYGSFLLAEHVLHASGVVTVIFAAWVFVHRRGPSDDGAHPELFIGFWDYLNQLAGGILFFVLGVTVGRHDFPWSWLIPGIVVLLIIARMVVVYGSALLFRPFRQGLPLAWQHVLVLGGLRGAVSAALVLMIPESYVYREYMLCLVLVLCLFTLVAHPPLLQAYLARRPLGGT